MKFKKKLKNGNIYLAMIISLAAVAVGAAVSAPGSDSRVETQEETFARITVVWEENEPETDAVNMEITGVADERTTAPLTTAENLPFEGEFAVPCGRSIGKDYSFGKMVNSKTMGDWRVHNGVDFEAAVGSDVIAVADGKITEVYKDELWGTVVTVDHGNGMVVRYCGIAANSALPQGSRIEKGDRIGALGEIPVEKADGEHLHLEVTVNGEYADPLEALNKTGLRQTEE